MTTKPLAVSQGTGVFTGYASVFNVADAQGDIVLPGAFAQSLKQRGPEGVRMLFQHDPKEPVGAWIEMFENQRGLYVRGRLNRKVQRGAELLALLEQRAIDGLSIGFRTVFSTRAGAGGPRRLHRIDLWEVSLVTFPMLKDARIERLKARAEALFSKEGV